jgi:hypothetical protein
MVHITKSNRIDYSHIKKGPKLERSIVPMQNRQDIMFKIKKSLSKPEGSIILVQNRKENNFINVQLLKL